MSGFHQKPVAVADYLNCKLLEKLSGWRDTSWCYEAYSAWVPSAPPPDLKPRGNHVMKKSSMICAAYDVGYLLDHLPRRLHIDGMFLYPCIAKLPDAKSKVWTAFYVAAEAGATPGIEARGLSPQDALVLLAIKMFKRGLIHEIKTH